MSLLWEVERYMRKTGTAPTRFGRDAVNDPGFVRMLRDGREPRRRTEAKVRKYIAEASA